MIGTARLLDESDQCSRHFFFFFLNLVLSEILLEGTVTLFSVLITLWLKQWDCWLKVIDIHTYFFILLLFFFFQISFKVNRYEKQSA